MKQMRILNDEFLAEQAAREAFAKVDYVHRRWNQPKECALPLCGKTENLLKCGRCTRRYYCCKEHQQQEWKEHKFHCKSFVDPPVILLEDRPHLPLDEEEREKLVKSMVEQFEMALRRDAFCATEEYDLVFGWKMGEMGRRIDMNTPIGKVMRGAWNNIVKRSDDTFEGILQTITDHLLRGDLPKYFRDQAHALRDECSYCRELWYREYKGIEWNQRLHFKMSGQPY